MTRMSSKTPAIAEVRLPGFVLPSRPGKVAVSVRIVQGTFRVGRAELRSPDGHVRPVSLLGMSHFHPDFAIPESREKWMVEIREGVVEAYIDGVTAADLTAGDHLFQDEAPSSK